MSSEYIQILHDRVDGLRQERNQLISQLAYAQANIRELVGLMRKYHFGINTTPYRVACKYLEEIDSQRQEVEP